MAQKFIGIDDAAEQLGVSKDRLNELREAGKLRAYRDGASWKFRTDDVDKLGVEGLPDLGADSGIGAGVDPLDSGLSLADEELDLTSSGGQNAGLSGVTLEDEPSTPSASTSDADLGAVDEPTVAADGDDDLVLDAEGSGDDAESILLSEAELGDSTRPPSTIIGKHELAIDDDDLELAPSDSDAPAAMSDVRLAEDDVLSADAGGSEVIPGAGKPPSGKFEDLEELEIDLEAESSRILDAKDVEAAQKAAEAAMASADSDLTLAPSDSGSSLSGLSGLSAEEAEKASDAGLTGMSSLELEGSDAAKASGAGLSGLSSIELAEDEEDDFVLGDSGSDITLSGDSGINLMPSDSGISLDDASQILGGSAIGSSLDLGEIGSGIEAADPAASGDLAPSEDFLLTPLGDDEGEDEEDSSQVIAMEAIEEDVASEDPLMGEAAMDFGGAAEATAATPAVSAAEASFPMWIMALLVACLFSMSVCGVMMVDMMRTIWSWQEPTSVGSALIDGLLSIRGN